MESSQVVQAPRVGGVLLAECLPADLERLAVKGFGAGVVFRRLIDRGKVVELARVGGIVLAERSAGLVEGLSGERLGELRPPQIAIEGRQVAQASGVIGTVVAKEPL